MSLLCLRNDLHTARRKCKTSFIITTVLPPPETIPLRLASHYTRRVGRGGAAAEPRKQRDERFSFVAWRGVARRGSIRL